MRWILTTLLAHCLQFGALGGGTFIGKVTSVPDGDTILVTTTDNKKFRIRLNGIDAPESKQAFGDKARDALSAKVMGKEVSVTWGKIDEYQRLLAYVYMGSTSINSEMVREGWAWHYAYYNKDPQLAAAQVSARNSRKGLWVGKNTVPPWEWRRKQRTSTSKPMKGSVKILTLLPNPKGKDEGKEQVTLINNSNKAVPLKGWSLRDKARNTYKLSGNIPAKGRLTIVMKSNSMPLNNDGDTITLLQGQGARQNFTYNKQQAKTGQVIKTEKK